MHKIFLVFITAILVNTPLWAMDLNQTTTIINEAKEATAGLQDEFNTILIEEPIPQEPLPIAKENPELNSSIEPVQASEIIEVNTTLVKESSKAIELNETKQVEENNTIIPTQLATPITQTDEMNETILIEKIPKSIPIADINNSTLFSDTNQSISEKNMSINTKNELNESVLIETIPKDTPITDINNSTLLSDTNQSISEEENMSIDNNESNDDTDIQGDSKQGLIIYKTRIKPYCDMNGERFAKQYAQEDWDDIFHDKEFKMEVIKACPKMKGRYRDKWTPHLYQFSLDYASDSDAIPDC